MRLVCDPQLCGHSVYVQSIKERQVYATLFSFNSSSLHTTSDRFQCLSHQHRLSYSKSLLTNALATGPSSMSSSSSVNGNLGMTQTRIGTSAMMITGNPIAAIVYQHQLQLVNLSCADDD
jgi:hypothetical protein